MTVHYFENDPVDVTALVRLSVLFGTRDVHVIARQVPGWGSCSNCDPPTTKLDVVIRSVTKWPGTEEEKS